MTHRVASSGMAGEDVRAIQHALNTWSGKPHLVPDGNFGSKTEQSVREFQRKANLSDHGRVGHHTRKALYPVGVATCTVLVTRDFGAATPPPVVPQQPSPLSMRFPAESHEALADKMRQAISNAPMKLTRIMGCPYHLFAPSTPNLISPMLAAPGQAGAPWFAYDHAEVQPGIQTTISPGPPHLHASTSSEPGHRHAFTSPGVRHDDAFILTMQAVYVRGPNDGPNLQLAVGGQASTTMTSPLGLMTLTPFVQLTDVDRFWYVGAFHFWQPFAQIGLQLGVGSNPQLQLSASPVNFSADVKNITFSTSAGAVANIDTVTGKVSVGGQFMLGVTVKLGVPGSAFW